MEVLESPRYKLIFLLPNLCLFVCPVSCLRGAARKVQFCFYVPRPSLSRPQPSAQSSQDFAELYSRILSWHGRGRLYI